MPIVDGAAQKAGIDYAAAGVQWENGCFSMELAGAYGLPQLKSLRRSFTVAESGVTLTDEIETDLPITERLVATEMPKAEPGKLTFCDAAVTFTPAVMPQVQQVEEAVEGGTQTLCLIDIPLPFGTEVFTLRME